MIHQFFRKETEIINITYHKIYILNIHMQIHKIQELQLSVPRRDRTPQIHMLHIFMTTYISKYRSLLTKSSEVPSLSSSKD